MAQNTLTILYWWLILFGLGVIFYPLTSIIFKRFLTRGYAFSKILAILSISYATWLAARLKLVPFSLKGILFFILLSTFLNLYLFQKRKQIA